MSSIPDTLEVAVQHHQAGRLQAAEAIYRKILAADPDQPDTLHLLGVFLAQTGRCDEAVEFIRQAIRKCPDFSPFHCSLGNVLQELGKFEEAAATYHKAIDLRPESVEAHNNLGNALQKLGQLDEAVASYRRALHFKPDYFEAHCNLGNALRNQGHLNEARAQFQQALQLNPGHAASHSDLGTILQLQGQLEGAVASYQQALRLQPDCLEVYQKLGFALTALKGLGRVTDATSVWQQWLEHDPRNPIALHMLAANTGQNVPPRSTDEFIRRTFDDFAATFDQKLHSLDYRGPELIAAAISEAIGAARGELLVLDAGCGTGLCGPLLRPYARRLIGVDLSPRMLELARIRASYDDLANAELSEYLDSAVQDYDLIVAADTLNYFGDLQPVLTGAARRQRPGGWLFFTLEDESSNQSAYRLQPHGRYCHSENYVRQTLEAAGYHIHSLTPASLRKEAGTPVQAMVVSARRLPVEGERSTDAVTRTEGQS